MYNYLLLARSSKYRKNAQFDLYKQLECVNTSFKYYASTVWKLSSINIWRYCRLINVFRTMIEFLWVKCQCIRHYNYKLIRSSIREMFYEATDQDSWLGTNTVSLLPTDHWVLFYALVRIFTGGILLAK